eukprot:CAMPEP_0115714588 /NCGR_PEP_ID=MMETSP0272-20121206/75319_1 /TAXON_ID=71861 /ORGANISM="Scrippsiella trochoidea, Strain CCMP3099" /LENGTH=50 /DNA_ID=CAMNT_0003156743 /DNA_START=86 /DNA_END=235 /DNA_ORIENTATION=-
MALLIEVAICHIDVADRDILARAATLHRRGNSRAELDALAQAEHHQWHKP